MKLCLYCTCMGQNTRALPKDVLNAVLDPDIHLHAVDRLCDAAHCAKYLSDENMVGTASPHIVIAACSSDARGAQALANTRSALPHARAALVDIREGCLWHSSASENVPAVADQAAALVRLGFVRLENAFPGVRTSASASLDVLVVGAGPAGMSAAANLAALGVPVTLVEKRPKKGGMAALLGKLFPHMSQASDLVDGLSLKGVSLRVNSEVVALRRKDDFLVVQLRCDGELHEEHYAAIILATGAQPVLPGDVFGGKSRKGVISQMELDTLLTAVENGNKEKELLAKHYVFVQCVHARSKDKPYCSAVCCPTAVKNALRLKTLRPDAEITVLNRQMVMPGIALENMYRSAMQAGVRFVHVEALDAIRVEGEESVETVVLPGITQETERRIKAEILVCSTPLQPTSSTVELARQLRLRTNGMGFVQGHEPAHPLESSVEGIFLCGSVRWPAYVEQAVAQGEAAAVLAARFVRERHMPKDELADPRASACIRQQLCSACGRCVEACPHGACSFDGNGVVHVVEELCRRCGVCAAICPCGAVQVPGASPSPREILAAVRQPRQRSLS